MAQRVLTETAASISGYKKNPMATVAAAYALCQQLVPRLRDPSRR